MGAAQTEKPRPGNHPRPRPDGLGSPWKRLHLPAGLDI